MTWACEIHMANVSVSECLKYIHSPAPKEWLFFFPRRIRNFPISQPTNQPTSRTEQLQHSSDGS